MGTMDLTSPLPTHTLQFFDLQQLSTVDASHTKDSHSTFDWSLRP